MGSKPLPTNSGDDFMLMPVLITLAIVVVLFVIVVMLRPNTFQVSRLLKMAAPASKTFEQVNDLHRMNAWNPWVKLEPAIKQTYEGEAAGVGAIYSWDGNSNVGAGRQTSVESRPSDLVRIKLEFFRPFRGTNDVEFSFQPQGVDTLVTWAMTGKYVFITKAMGLFMSMDKMIGGSFEKGLADMKSIVEAGG
jgi:polyketide cyclase/dehydrase/lipid transport protein